MTDADKLQDALEWLHALRGLAQTYRDPAEIRQVVAHHGARIEMCIEEVLDGMKAAPAQGANQQPK